MPKKARELSPIEVQRLSKPGFHAVGGVSGLHLRIQDSGARSWILRVVVGNKRRDMGLGGFPEIPIKTARDEARRYKNQIREGLDPIIQRRTAKAALIEDQAKQITFKEAARRCHQSKVHEFRSVKHGNDWIRSLEMHAFPKIGNLPVGQVELPQIMQVLEPIWHDRTETATRVRQRLESVLTWASVSKLRSGENPARWEGNLKELLANPSKLKKVEHHPALPWQQMGQFMADLRQREGMAARALEFAILTAARSGEVRGMMVKEIDYVTKIWTVPAGRIKAGKEHKVPLSPEAISLLKSLPDNDKSQYVFPAVRNGQLSDMSLIAVVRRMGLKVVPHGFRSTFKDWARSCTSYPDEVSELALAHVNSDSTRAAYARDELLPQRTRMMKDWAKFCNTVLPTSKNVSQIKRKA